MPVNSKNITGRRTVTYSSYDEFWSDAESMANQTVRTLGNWSQAQIYKHLAMSLDSSIDGSPFLLPAPVRWLMSLLMKRRFLYRPIPSGFKAPPEYVPSPQEPLSEALSDLRRAVERVTTESRRALHPGFGRITREEWDLFNLRHAEMHMSFLVPSETP